MVYTFELWKVSLYYMEKEWFMKKKMVAAGFTFLYSRVYSFV